MRTIFAKFWKLVDSDSVRLYIWPYYLALLAWAIYATFWAQPIVIVEAVVGHVVYNWWIWLQIPGTIFPLVGLTLRRGGMTLDEMSHAILFQEWLGLWMQFAGHSCMFFVLLCFEISGITGAYWGQAAFSLFAIAPYTLGCFLLSLQCGRKLWKAEQMKLLLETVKAS